MNRRTLLKALSVGALSALGGRVGWQWGRRRYDPSTPEPPPLDPLADEGGLPVPPAEEASVDSFESYLEKIRFFDRFYPEDVVLGDDRIALLESTEQRLARVQRNAGHGNFNLLCFDDAIKLAKRYSSIGAFTREELDFLEEVFSTDASDYGFFGDKVIADLTARIQRREVVKVAGTGHYLFRGDPQKKYEKMRADLGDSLVLTSGIRGVVKQAHLFLAKARTTEGNLSQASRSLAPPGYSYHAVGDFDVGKVGLGAENFTETFAETEEYKKLVDLGYVAFRYTETNPFGVRHEPWHIKMAEA